MDAHNAVAAFRAYQHHLNVTEPGVTDFENNVVNNNINSSVTAPTVHSSTNVSNNYSLSQRINIMATIFANSNSQNNTITSTNANVPLLTSISSIPENSIQNPVLQQSAAVAAAALLSATASNANINAISNHFSPVAYQRSLNNSVAISAAAAAAALINLPSVVAASATNAVAEYVATQQPRNLQNLNQNVYPSNLVSYISSNIQNRSSNFSYSTSNNGSAALTHPYALISAPLCATSPNNHASCSLHQQNHNINREVDLLNNPFAVNSNHVVQPGNSQQLVPFLKTNLINSQRNQRTSALTSSSRSLKRSAAQISTSNDLFISNEEFSNSQINHNSSFTLERTREISSVAETPLLSTVLISTQSRSENTDELSLRSRILSTSSSRVPKLRRIDSFEEEIVNTANLQAATTAIVQLQRHSEEGRNVIAQMNIPSVVTEEENLHNSRSIPIARIYHSPNYSVHQYMAAIDASSIPLSENVLTAAYSTIPLLTNRSTVQMPRSQSFSCPVCRQSVVPQTPAAVITCNCVHHHCHHHHHAVCAICQQQQLIEQQSQNQQLTNIAAAFEQQNEQSNVQNNIPRSIHNMRLPNVLLNIAATLAQAQNQTRNIDALSHQQQIQNSLANAHLHSQTHRREINPMHATVLTNRYAHQEREQQSTALFYRQQQQNQLSQQNQFQSQQSVITSPLIMVEDHPAAEIMGLSMLLFRPNETTTLVLNGAGGTPASVVHQHAAAAAVVAASAAEQPVGTTIEQIKKNSSLFIYYKDPKIPEQERERCTVCLIEFETDDSLRSLHCSHLFHIECIDRWLLYNKKCPVCRVDMDKASTPIAQTAI